MPEETVKNPSTTKPKGLQDSICWNCKRALNLPDCRCSWAKNFTPVKGWKTVEGGLLSNHLGRATVVLECPEYVQYHKYTTLKQVAQEVCRELEISPSKLQKGLLYWFKKYEKKTGKELPGWTIIEGQEQLERVEAAKERKAEEKAKGIK